MKAWVTIVAGLLCACEGTWGGAIVEGIYPSGANGESSGPENQGVDTGNALTDFVASARHGTDLIALDANGTAFQFDEIWISVHQIRFELDSLSCDELHEFSFETPVGCDETNNVTVGGRAVFDAVRGAAYPALTELTIPRVAYKNLTFHFLPAQDDFAEFDPRLRGFSFYAAGSYELDGLRHNFDIAFPYNESEQIAVRTPFVVGEHMTLALDVSGWLSALPVTDCLRGGQVPVQDDIARLGLAGGPCAEISTQFLVNFSESRILSDGS